LSKICQELVVLGTDDLVSIFELDFEAGQNTVIVESYNGSLENLT
jgi:hypothetical protein